MSKKRKEKFEKTREIVTDVAQKLRELVNIDINGLRRQIQKIKFELHNARETISEFKSSEKILLLLQILKNLEEFVFSEKPDDDYNRLINDLILILRVGEFAHMLFLTLIHLDFQIHEAERR